MNEAPIYWGFFVIYEVEIARLYKMTTYFCN